MKKKTVPLNFTDIEAEILYHSFEEVGVKTLLLTFREKRRVLSTLEGFKEVKYVGNHFSPASLWNVSIKTTRNTENGCPVLWEY